MLILHFYLTNSLYWHGFLIRANGHVNQPTQFTGSEDQQLSDMN